MTMDVQQTFPENATPQQPRHNKRALASYTCGFLAVAILGFLAVLSFMHYTDPTRGVMGITLWGILLFLVCIPLVPTLVFCTVVSLVYGLFVLVAISHQENSHPRDRRMAAVGASCGALAVLLTCLFFVVKSNPEIQVWMRVKVNNIKDWMTANGDHVNKVNAEINDKGESLIHLAAKEGRVDELARLNKQRANLNIRDKDGVTPMHWAAWNNHVDAMKYLKDQDADLNARSTNGRTPMHWAAWAGHVAAMQWLKEQGVDVNVTANDGQPPMHRAAAGGHIAAMKWLKEQGADVSFQSKTSSRTPMHRAAEAGHVEAMKWLKEQGADVNAKAKNGQTPLSVVSTDSPKAREWLLANGAK